MKRNWYKFRIKYTAVLDSGKKKNGNAEYLVDAMSFTEAEARAVKTADEVIGTRDFDVTAISRENVSEILRDGHDTSNPWFKAGVAIITADDEKGEMKESAMTVYLQASTTRDADNILRQHMKDSTCVWDIKSITRTGVADILDYRQK